MVYNGFRDRKVSTALHVWKEIKNNIMNDRDIETGLGKLEGWGDKSAGLERCLREIQRISQKRGKRTGMLWKHLFERYRAFEKNGYDVPGADGCP